MRSMRTGVLFVFLVTIMATAGYGQATRTWVSGVGDDANPCSRTAPCKTFAGAISKTATNGVIDVLDPGGFGAVTITKSITIENRGSMGGILASLTKGVIINGANIVVVLHGLSIQGAGNGTVGVDIVNAGAVFIEDCTIDGFQSGTAGVGFGVDFRSSTNGATLTINDSIIKNNISHGVFVHPPVGVLVSGAIDNVRFEHNLTGVRVEDRGTMVVRNSVAANNVNHGFIVQGTAAAARLTVEHSTSAHHVISGVAAVNGQAFLTISNVILAHNGNGILNSGAPVVIGCGDNRNFSNGASAATTCPAGSTP